MIPVSEAAGPSRPVGDSRALYAALIDLERSFGVVSESFVGSIGYVDRQLRAVWSTLIGLSTELSCLADEPLSLDDLRGLSFDESLRHSERVYERIHAVDMAIRAAAPQFGYRPPPRP